MGSLIGDFISDNFNKLKRHLQYTFDELSEADAEDIIQSTAAKLLGRGGGRVDYISSYVIYYGHKKVITGDWLDNESDLVWYFNSNTP